jgi:hypothetical protein
LNSNRGSEKGRFQIKIKELFKQSLGFCLEHLKGARELRFRYWERNKRYKKGGKRSQSKKW